LQISANVEHDKILFFTKGFYLFTGSEEIIFAVDLTGSWRTTVIKYQLLEAGCQFGIELRERTV
jgi:hypothetical protein